MRNLGSLAEISDLVVGAIPVDLSAAANNGRWFNMQNCDGLNAILIAAVGTAGDDPVITLQQATDSSGTGSKELLIYDVQYKIGSTDIAAADDQWVDVTTIDDDNGASSYDTDPIAGAENELVVCVYIRAGDLDVNNDFNYCRMTVADVGTNAQLGTILYIPSSPAYGGKKATSFLT